MTFRQQASFSRAVGVEYRQLYAGSEAAVQAEFSQWLQPQLQDGQKAVNIDEGQPSIR